MHIRYSRRAQAFLEHLGPDDYHDVRGLVLLLASEPSVDGKTKVWVTFAPAVFPCYVGERWWILYQVTVDAARQETLYVMGIGPATSRPTLYDRRPPK